MASQSAVHPVTRALRHFKKVDPVLYAAAQPHVVALKQCRASTTRRPSGQALFASLAASVAGQQLSTKAADTIWMRLVTACGGTVTPQTVLSLSVEDMRAAGLSAAKVRTLTELATTIQDKRLNLAGLRRVSEEEAIAELTAIWGIGRWTAEMFLMFALESPDIFSSGDLGLRRSMESLYSLPKDTPAHTLEAIAQKWSPYRTLASRILWRVRDTTNTTSG